jgi:RNA polymerase sigma-70 factor, ECF subfamily
MDTDELKSNHTPQDEAFVHLLELHKRRMFAYIGTLLPRWADAEEVLQRTTIVLWRKFDQFDPSTDFVCWAYAVAYWESLYYLKQEGHRRHVFGAAVLEKLARTHVARSDLLEKQHFAIDDCVARLSPSDREIIEHYYYQGRKTAAEVARELGRPTNTILKALIRIRGSLQHCIDEVASSEERR